MKVFWFLVGALSLLLAVIGIVLPLMPTVPFLLLAAYAFARSSPAFHDWLISHPVLGKPILDWRRNGAIRRPLKLWALASLCFVFGMSVALGAPLWVLAAQASALLCVGIFIWTRPEGERPPADQSPRPPGEGGV